MIKPLFAALLWLLAGWGSTASAVPNLSASPPSVNAVNATVALTVQAGSATSCAGSNLTLRATISNPTVAPAIAVGNQVNLLQNGTVVRTLPITSTATATYDFAFTGLTTAESGSYQVEVENPSTSTIVISSNSLTVTVNPVPAGAISKVVPGTSENTACVNQTTEYQVLDSDGNPFTNGETFVWTTNPATPVIIQGFNNQPTVLIRPTTTTTFTINVAVTSSAGCTRTISATMIPVNGPTYSAPVSSPVTSAVAPLCPDQQAIISISGTPTPFNTTFTWEPAAYTGAVSGTYGSIMETNITATDFAQSITYTVTGVDPENGCPTYQNITVHKRADLPLVISPQPALVCRGSTFSLSASAGFTSYSWTTDVNSADIISGANAQTATIRCNASGVRTFTVTAANSTCQTKIATVTISVEPSIALSAFAFDNELCAGEGTLLNASAGFSTYSWLPVSGLDDPTSQFPFATPSATTTYTVTATDGNGCNTTATVTVLVNANPAVTVAPNTPTICLGQSAGVTLTATNIAGATYAWDEGSGTFANGQSVTVNPLATTTYSVFVTNAAGCVSVATSTVTVQPTPSVAIDAPGGTDICLGAPAVLVASGANTYAWSVVQTGQTGTGGALTLTPGFEGTYDVVLTGTDAFGCTDVDNITLTATQNPAATIIINAAATEGCRGANIALTAVCPNGCTFTSVTWTKSGAGGLSSTTGANVTATVNGTTDYVATGFINGQCAGQATITINEIAAPTATILEPVVPICLGEQALLSVDSPQSGYQYVWNPGALPGPNVSVTPTSTTVYTLTVTDVATTCTATFNAQVVVNPAPQINIVGGAVKNICTGRSIDLSATNPDQTLVTNYVWVSSTGETFVGQTITVSPASTATYTVTGTTTYTFANTALEAYCPGSATVTVTVTAFPNVAASADRPVLCDDGSTALLTGANAVAYEWYDGSSGFPVGTSTQYVANPPVGTTVYTLVGYDMTGCVNSTTITVIRNALPDVAATVTDNDVCAGETFQLGANSSISGLSFSWAPAAGLSNPNVANPTASAQFSTTYTITVMDANGCQNSDQVTVNVNPLPSVALSADDFTPCFGVPVVLTATSATGVAYDFQPAGLISAFLAPDQVEVYPSGIGAATFSVTVTDANGCQSTQSTSLNVLALPSLTVTPAPAVLCEGEAVNLTASTNALQPSVVWLNGGNPVGAGLLFNASPPVGVTEYACVVTDLATGCETSSLVFVTVNPLPTLDVVGTNELCLGNTYTLFGNGAQNYVWSILQGNADAAANGNQLTIRPLSTETIVVGLQGTDVLGCVNNIQETFTVGGAAFDGSIAISASATSVCPLVNQVVLNAECLNGCSFTAGQFTWTDDMGNLVGLGTQTLTVFPTQTTTYFLTAFVDNQCAAMASITINVIPPPAVYTDVPVVNICQGGTALLESFQADPLVTSYEYRWFDDSGALIGNFPYLNVSPTAEINGYRLNVRDIYTNCETELNYTVTVSQPPNVRILQGATVRVCRGLAATLSAAGAVSYVWESLDPLYAGVQSGENYTVTPLQNTTYRVIGTDVNGCTNVALVDVEVLLPPNLTISGPEYLCASNSQTQTSGSYVATGAAEYLWTDGFGNIASVTNTLNVSGLTSDGYYNLRGLSADGCEAYAELNVRVYSPPVIDLTWTKMKRCVGQTLLLEAYTDANIASAQWTSNRGAASFAGLTNQTVVELRAHEPGVTTYTVALTDLNGCVSTAQATLEVYEDFAFNVTSTTTGTNNNFSVCRGENTTLTAVGNGSFVWTYPNGTNVATPSITVSPLFTTVYTVVGTGAGTGCKTTQTVTVTILERPAVSATVNDNQICGGETVTLTASATSSNGGPFTFDWQPTLYMIGDAVGATVTARPAETVNFTVRAFDAAGCSSTATVEVRVNNSIGNNIVVTGNRTICPETSTTLTAAQISGSTPFDWVEWTRPDGISFTGNPMTLSPETTTTYTVTAYNAEVCTVRTTVTVTVRPYPAVQIMPPISTTICRGQSLILRATGATQFAWQADNDQNFERVGPTNWVTIKITPQISTTYTVTGTNAFGCVATDVITIYVEEPPLVVLVESLDNQTPIGSQLFICRGESTTLTAVGAEGSGAGIYNWQPSTGLSATFGNVVTASPLVTTTYTVRGRNAETGCINSDVVTVVVRNLPTFSIAADDPVLCPGETATLTASGGVAGTYQWYWNTASGQQIFTGNPLVASPSVTTTYSVYGEDENGCSGMATFTVQTVASPPVVATATKYRLCKGQSTQLNSTGSGSWTYQWFGPNGPLPGGNAPTYVVSPEATTVYTLVAQDVSGTGCFGEDTVVVVVDDAPVLTASPAQTSVCVGGTANLLVSGPNVTSFTWAGAGIVSTNGGTAVVQPLIATTYTVVGRTSNGCESVIEIPVTVEPVGAVTITAAGAVNGEVTICRGSSLELMASGPSNANYQWLPLSSIVPANGVGQSVTVSPTTETVYSVTRSGLNCTSTATIRVKIFDEPALAVTPATPSGCTGQPLTLTATGGLFYTWSTGANGATIQVTHNQPGIYPYTVSVPYGNGCTLTQTVNVVIHPEPVLTVTPDHTPVCDGDVVVLTVSGASQFYEWYDADDNFLTSGPSIAVPVGLSTVNYVVRGGIDACMSETVYSVVPQVPVFDIFANRNRFCRGEGAGIQLTSSSTLNYVWNPSTGLTYWLGDGSIVGAMPQSTTTYTITAVDANGCTSRQTLTLEVVEPAQVFVTQPEQQICRGQSATLVAGGSISYSWSPAPLFNNGNIVIVSPENTTIYTITGTDINGCTSVANAIVFVEPVPQLVVSENRSICQGATVELTANGAFAYSWLPATGLSATTGSSVMATPLVSTTYTVTGVSLNGCVSTETIHITVDPHPVLETNTDVYVMCSNSYAVLSAFGAESYVWSPGTYLNTTTGATVTATPPATTTYTVIGTYLGGCRDTATIRVEVINAPQLTQVATNPTICLGESATLEATGGTAYTWYNANGLPIGTGATIVVSPSQTSTYSVTGVGPNGCLSTATATVTVNSVDVQLTANETYLCGGDTLVLTATGNATNYIWQRPGTGGSVITQMGANLTQLELVPPVGTTTYTLTGTAFGCIDVETITVVVRPSANFNVVVSDNIICRGEAVQILLTQTPAINTYTLSYGTQTMPAPTFFELTPEQTTTYTVTGRTELGCVRSRTFTITVNEIPNLTVTNDLVLCAGESVTLQASGADTYQWSPAIGNASTTNAAYTVTPAQTTTFTILGYLANGCGVMKTVRVTVIPAPNLSVTAPVTDICLGTSVTLTASGGQSYFWYNNATNQQVGQGPSITVSPSATTTYRVEATVTTEGVGSCTRTHLTTVTVAAPPQLAFNPQAGLITVDLNNFDAARTPYMVRVTGANTAFEVATDTFPLRIEGLGCGEEYTIRVTDKAGCQTTQNVSTPLPSGCSKPTVIGFNVLSHTGGRIIATSVPGALTYYWYIRLAGASGFSPLGFSTTNEFSVINLTPGALYDVYVEVDCGCGARQASNIAQVSTYTPPAITVTDNCATTLVQLTDVNALFVVNQFEIMYRRNQPGAVWQTLNLTGNDAAQITLPLQAGEYEFKARIRHLGYYSEYRTVVRGTGVNCRLGDNSETTDELSPLYVYPNPSKGDVWLAIGAKTDGQATATVMDLSGKLVYSTRLNIERGENRAMLDLNDLAKGMYVLRFESADGTQTSKLIIE